VPEQRPSILAFIGADEARVKEAALAAANKWTSPDADEFSNDIINGHADKADDAAHIIHETIQSLQTVPFFGGNKIVWLKNANFFGDNALNRAATTTEALDFLIKLLESGLPDDVLFILSTTSALDKRGSFYKKLAKLAKLESFDKVDISRSGWQIKLLPLVRKRASQMKLSFAHGADELFVMLVGEETRQIDAELEKLSIYCGPNGTADEQTIRTLVAKTRSAIVFEIGDAIGRRNLPLAMSCLEHSLSLGNSPILILRAGIIPKVRNLLHARDLLNQSKLPTHNYQQFQSAMTNLPDSETAHLPRNKSGELSLYPLFLSLGEAKRFTIPELVDSLKTCLQADHDLVYSSQPPAFILSRTIIRIAGHHTDKASA